jgi:hypothetical protein
MDTHSKGLHDVGSGCYAWLQPDGGWGWSNSGVITGSGASLLVDTLFDLATTAEMLDGIAAITNRFPLQTLVNTHSDGDHYFDNQLLADRNVKIVASDAAAALMTQQTVDELAALKRADGKLGQFARAVLAPFTWPPGRQCYAWASPAASLLASTTAVPCAGSTSTAKSVVVYLTLMTRRGPELSGSGRSRWISNHLVAQQRTGNNRTCPDLWSGNPLVAGSSPARPIFQDRRRDARPGTRCVAAGGRSTCSPPRSTLKKA